MPIGTARSGHTVYQRKMPERLKKRCANATASVYLSFSASAASAARTPVTVVPMLAPSTVGYMRSSLMTPTPTSGVSALVVMELDCTRTVRPKPTAIAR